LINTKTGAVLLGLATSSIPQDGSITELRPYCFAGSSIHTVKIPEGVTTIPSNAFSHCSLLDTVELPSTITTLDATCFAWCYALKTVTLPASLTDIKTYVFSSCPFEEVTIPAAVNNILDNAFGNQSKLKSVTFKKKLDANGNIIAPFIHKNAFANSAAVDGVVFNVPWSEDYDYNYIESIKNADGTTESVKIDPTGWGAKNFTINYNYIDKEAD
jgi:hypothetical protein